MKRIGDVWHSRGSAKSCVVGWRGTARGVYAGEPCEASFVGSEVCFIFCLGFNVVFEHEC